MSYLAEARRRALRRRSPWNFLLVPAIVAPWALLWYLSASVIAQVARRLHPELSFVLIPDSGGGILIVIGLCFAWLPVAMILANLMVVVIPAAKRTLDDEARDVPGTDFVSANRGLLKVMAVMTPLGLLIAFLGMVLA
jgi:hypothetical protein